MESIEMSIEFPASPEQLYAAWLDSEMHSEFTGGLAAIQDKVGSRYTTWDGYITGTVLELEEGRRILHSWKTTEFPEGAEESLLEIIFERSANGCTLRLKHWNIPEGQSKNYEKGWDEHYFRPMKKFFSEL